MPFGLMFWILMLIWAVWGLLWHNGWSGVAPYGPFGNSLLMFILFMLLGWRVFGAPLHG